MLVISSPWRVGYDPIFWTGTDKCKVTVIWCAWSGTLRWKGRKDESWWIVNHKDWAQTNTVPPASVCQGLWSTHQEGLRWDRDCLAMSCQWRFVALHETWYTCLLGMIWSLIGELAWLIATASYLDALILGLATATVRMLQEARNLRGCCAFSSTSCFFLCVSLISLYVDMQSPFHPQVICNAFQSSTSSRNISKDRFV